MYASSQGTLVVREEKPYHHAMRPYGTLGPPYIISKHILLYPTKRVRFGWKLLEKKRLTEQLNKCFPSMYVLSHSVCLLLLSIIQIALQIALMCTNGALWYVASGIWGGVYFVIVAAYGIFLVYNRTYWSLMISYVLHLFGILMGIGSFLVVNIIAISLYTDECCQAFSFNNSVKPINYVCFFLGVICIIMLLVYLVLLPCFIMDSYNQHVIYQEEIAKQKLDKSPQVPNELDDSLMHSSLYAQNSVNEDGSMSRNSIVNILKTNYSEYPVIQAKV